MQNNLFISREEMLGTEKKRVAVYSEGLSIEELKSALNFLKQMEKDGYIDKPGHRYNHDGYIASIGFDLHECLVKYPQGPSGKKKTAEERLFDGNNIEFMRLLVADEVWVFDKGQYPEGGRLDERLKTMDKPVRYLMRVGGTWDFYRSKTYFTNDETNTIDEVYQLVGELEPYEPTEEETNVPKKTFFRHFSEESMTKKEYDITFRAIKCNVRAGAMEIASRVIQDEKMEEIANKILSDGTEIFFGIQTAEILTEELLKTYEAKLDFMEAELDDYAK